VFISIGGSRGSTGRTGLNLVIVFVLAGFWHGAAWNFVLWGMYHGTWLLLERAFGLRSVDDKPRLPLLRHITTIMILITGSVLFRSPSIGFAWDYFKAMWSFTGGLPNEMIIALDNVTIVALVVAFASIFIPGSFGAIGKRLADGRSAAATRSRALVMATVLPVALIVATASIYQPFLYFRF
jgi:alginate O-acetyltransferase complex protein AlgI